MIMAMRHTVPFIERTFPDDGGLKKRQSYFCFHELDKIAAEKNTRKKDEIFISSRFLAPLFPKLIASLCLSMI
jgi:hypothetical protein